jgi:hypothetical protein
MRALATVEGREFTRVYDVDVSKVFFQICQVSPRMQVIVTVSDFDWINVEEWLYPESDEFYSTDSYRSPLLKVEITSDELHSIESAKSLCVSNL